MISSENNFYEQYGLTHVRDAMKRPFCEAFPAWTADPSSVPPVVPQIRTHWPSAVPQWMVLPAIVEENPAEKQKVEGTHPPQLTAPSSFLRSSLPVLAMRSQTKDLSTPPDSPLADAKRGEATQNYWLEDVTDADLAKCVQWLGLEQKNGMHLMQHIFVQNVLGVQIDAHVENMKASIAMLMLVGEKIGQGGKNMSRPLIANLIASTACYLKNVHNKFRHSSSVNKALVIKFTLALLNQFPVVCGLFQKYANLKNLDDYRFVGGMRRFEFILWCNQEKIQLTEAELDALINLATPGKEKNSAIYHAIKI